MNTFHISFNENIQKFNISFKEDISDFKINFGEFSVKHDLCPTKGYTLQVIDGVAYFIYGEQIQPTPIFLTYEVVTSGI